MTRPALHCVRCGYDLTGVGGEAWGTCPECGHAFDPSRPSPKPWPHPARLALVLAAPTTACILLAVGASFIAPAILACNTYGIAETLGLLLGVAGFLVPLVVAWRLASVHAVRYERLLVWLVLAVIGELYAIGLAFSLVVAASRLSL